MFMTENIQAALLSLPLELQRMSAELQAGLAQSHAGNRLTGARPVDVTRRLAWGGPGRLVGWSIRADVGAVTLTLRNGRDSTGEVLGTVELATDQSHTVWMGPGGVDFGEALFLDVTGAGTLVGAVYLGAVD